MANPLSSKRASLGTSRSQKGASYQDVLTEVGPAFFCWLDQVSPELVLTLQSNEGNSTWGGNQKRFHEAQKSYQCEKGPKIFRYFSWVNVHERRHNNERTFICAACNEGFFQASDLHWHQKIHAGKKPFRCSMCTKSFSHRTNLLAHESIHMGEKPYVCSVCPRCYHQSSTYQCPRPPPQDTPEDCLQTCFLHTRSFLDVMQINMSCYVYCHSTTLFRTYFITLQLYFPFIVFSTKIYA